jgi:hypothetical protein
MGRVDVHTGGVNHIVSVRCDQIEQRPRITVDEDPSAVKNGSEIHLYWPRAASLLNEARPGDFYRAEAAEGASPLWHLLCGYALFNPHIDITTKDAGGCSHFPAGDPAQRKWHASEPTSAHWYNRLRLGSLIGAYLALERAGTAPRSVREFVAEFRGLSSTTKRMKVTTAAGLSHCRLADLVEGDGVDSVKVDRLLRAMQAYSRPVEPRLLGVLGEEHHRRCLARDFGAEPESVRYRRKLGSFAGIPYVLEVAFAVKRDDEDRRTVLTGVNWSPLLTCPFPELHELATEMRLDEFDPVVLSVHVACPHLPFADRGKGHVELPAQLAQALTEAVRSVVQGWKKQKRQADRRDRLTQRQLEGLRRRTRRDRMTVRDAAFRVMRQAYLQTSDHGRLPANARQIMYVARPLVQDLLGGRCWKDSNYFTQTLLPTYCREHAAETAEWDVVFDARGHLIEPHTGRRIGLGTLGVRRYVADWQDDLPVDLAVPTLDLRLPTRGPENRYHFVLFIEKEGFDPLLEAARIANRFDLAIMSTKGMSVTAARRLLEHFAEKGVTVLVMHDFDKSGFSILHTLSHDTPRYRFRHRPRVVDLGLRLADVRRLELPAEEVHYRGIKRDPRLLLKRCGASKAERNFLVNPASAPGWHGQRVELNAMRPAVFIEYLEGKLREQGVGKVIPGADGLTAAFQRTRQGLLLQRVLGERHAEIVMTPAVAMPPALEAEVRRRLDGSDKSWDEVLAELIEERGADIA